MQQDILRAFEPRATHHETWSEYQSEPFETKNENYSRYRIDFVNREELERTNEEIF